MLMLLIFFISHFRNQISIPELKQDEFPVKSEAKQQDLIFIYHMPNLKSQLSSSK